MSTVKYIKEMKHHLPKREYKYLISICNPYEVTIEEAIKTFIEIVRSPKRSKKSLLVLDELKNYKEKQNGKK